MKTGKRHLKFFQYVGDTPIVLTMLQTARSKLKLIRRTRKLQLIQLLKARKTVLRKMKKTALRSA